MTTMMERNGCLTKQPWFKRGKYRSHIPALWSFGLHWQEAARLEVSDLAANQTISQNLLDDVTNGFKKKKKGRRGVPYS